MLKRISVLGVLAMAIALTVTVTIRHYTASSQSAYALRVNGQTLSPEEVSTRVATAQRVADVARYYDPSATVVGDSASDVAQVIVSQTLELQEAQRRGLACTQVEADAEQATVVARAPSPDDNDVALQQAAALGIVPLDYAKTPPGSRTPSASDVIAAYLSDPRITSAGLRTCIIGKLFAQERTAAGGGAAGERAIQALQRRLRASATVDGPALTPAPSSATPAP